MQCRSHAAQLGRIYEELKQKNIEVLLILGASIEKAEQYSISLHLPFPVLADPERSVYHQYGLEKTMIVIQRTASIIVDCNGIIQYSKTTSSPMIWLQEAREVQDFTRSMVATC